MRRLRHGVLKEARIDAGVGPYQVADNEASAVVCGRHPRRLADGQVSPVLQPRQARRRHACRVALHVDAAAFPCDDERRRQVG